MPSVTLSLTIAKDDKTKDAIAFEGRGTKRVFDRKKDQFVEIPKWNWIARSKLDRMERLGGNRVQVTLPEWVARKAGLLD